MENADDLTLLRLFRHAAHHLDSTRKYRGQGWLLILLRERGAMTQRELTTLTGRRSATLSEQLRNLDRAGLITRERDGADRRNLNLSLTAEGLAAAARVQAERAELAGTLFAGLSPEEKRQLIGLLQKLLPLWRQLPREKEEELK